MVDDGQRVLHLESHNDRATITRDLRGSVSLARTPILRWRWKVLVMPTGGDARRRETADQAAQVYVTWPRPPALLRSRIIGYAWDTTAPAGSTFRSEKTGTVTYIILRSGPAELGRWVEERRDVRAGLPRHLRRGAARSGRDHALDRLQRHALARGIAHRPHPLLSLVSLGAAAVRLFVCLWAVEAAMVAIWPGSTRPPACA